MIFLLPDRVASRRAASGQNESALSRMSVGSISTSPPGGNQVDGLPPAFSNFLTQSYLNSSGRWKLMTLVFCFDHSSSSICMFGLLVFFSGLSNLLYQVLMTRRSEIASGSS